MSAIVEYTNVSGLQYVGELRNGRHAFLGCVDWKGQSEVLQINRAEALKLFTMDDKLDENSIIEHKLNLDLVDVELSDLEAVTHWTAHECREGVTDFIWGSRDICGRAYFMQSGDKYPTNFYDNFFLPQHFGVDIRIRVDDDGDVTSWDVLGTERSVDLSLAVISASRLPQNWNGMVLPSVEYECKQHLAYEFPDPCDPYLWNIEGAAFICDLENDPDSCVFILGNRSSDIPYDLNENEPDDKASTVQLFVIPFNKRITEEIPRRNKPKTHLTPAFFEDLEQYTFEIDELSSYNRGNADMFYDVDSKSIYLLSTNEGDAEGSKLRGVIHKLGIVEFDANGKHNFVPEVVKIWEVRNRKPEAFFIVNQSTLVVSYDDEGTEENALSSLFKVVHLPK